MTKINKVEENRPVVNEKVGNLSGEIDTVWRTKGKFWCKNKNLKIYLFTRKDVQITNKHMKRCFTAYGIREMQIKTTIQKDLIF